MDCFLCKGKLTESTTTYMADLGNIIVIVKNVPCHKCIQCGEESFSGTAVVQLERKEQCPTPTYKLIGISQPRAESSILSSRRPSLPPV